MMNAFHQGESHAQITEYHLAIPACIRPDLRLPLRRYFYCLAAANYHFGSIIGMLILFVLLRAANSARQMG